MLDFVLFYRLEYLGGMANKPPALPCLIIVISLTSQALLLLASVVALSMCISRKLSKKRLIISVLSLSVALIVCLVNFPLFPSNVRPAGAQIFLKGFEKWVTKNVETDSIQTWIRSTDEKHWNSRILYGPDYPAEERIPEEFPDFLKDFGVQYMYFERSELDNSKIIHFEWGGAMFHWSLVIGNPNMKMPQQEVEWFSYYDVEFRRILKPGVYVFSRG